MPEAVPQAIAVSRALTQVMRNDRGRLIAALVARLGNFQLAEDALHDAALSAHVHWGRSGLPTSPQGWLIKVANRKALDRLRGEGRNSRRENILAELAAFDSAPNPDDIPDERLRLIFTCCHPALDEKSRVALTLRTVCGLSTEEIARLFLDASPTMGQRLSRAKTKIAAAGIAYRVPPPDDWSARLQTVLTTIYLIFTRGYLAEQDEPRDLCSEAIFLARMLLHLCPDDPEIEGALALLLITHARHAARIGPDGATVPLSEQDQALWNLAAVTEGRSILDRALARRRAGPFQIKAAISSCQMLESGPDWRQIVELYTVLLLMEPTPIVRLNHAVAMAETGSTRAALEVIGALKSELDHFQPYHAAAAAIHDKAGNRKIGRCHREIAIALTDNEADRRLLRKKLFPQSI